MSSYGATYHTQSSPDDGDRVTDLARDARDVLRRNDRDQYAWHYGLPSAGRYRGAHSAHRASYTRAVATDYQALCRWLAARGYPV